MALDAGMSVDDLMAVVDEAARGGAPVMRYRAWSPDGSMVNAPPPPVQVCDGFGRASSSHHDILGQWDHDEQGRTS